MSISRDEVAHIGRLARLDLSAAEMESLTHDLGEILGYVEKISALDSDTDEVRGAPGAASAKSVQATAPDIPSPTTPMRDDLIQPSLTTEQALRPSADHDAEFFRVPPVIEREEA
ncbi:MAG: Asp-tRNA(Asn)/Glu-tRNA(Gln) amidotransferase subunit GatC [Candidatus Eisenbacteria bacterium]|nr:Asp-tRNA(Asn)/Glu-tRNA(Gln) amidotransferase subunit GatC [Candidatus Eisenbacteria bacterium]